MRKLLLAFLALTLFLYATSQDQPFKSGFIFKSSLANNSANLFFKQIEIEQEIEIGTLKPSGEKLFTRVTMNDPKNVTPQEVYGKEFRGIIEERNGDSLFIKIWPYKSKTTYEPKYVGTEDQDETLVLVIKDWHTTPRNNQVKDLPYRNRQFIAANFPIRFNPTNGQVKSGFTNASITYTWVYGHARIYKSDFIEPRYRFWGWGPMLGIGTRNREDDEDKEDITMTGGMSLTASIYGVKILFTGGLERGFNIYSKKVTPFLGIGFGLDIYSLVDPEIKKKE